MSAVTFIEPYDVAGEQPGHEGREARLPCPDERMSMIRHKRPRVAARARFRKECSQSRKKGITVVVIGEDCSSLYAPNHDVMEHAG